MGKEPHPVPIVEFADKRYDLVATFLLAEARSFAREILEALDEVCVRGKASGSFSGNVFSLEIARDTTTVADDIMGQECQIPTAVLRDVVEAYQRACLNL